MQSAKEEILLNLKKVLEEMGIKDLKIELTRPGNEAHGDYTTNVAMTAFQRVSRVPQVPRVSREEGKEGKIPKVAVGAGSSRPNVGVGRDRPVVGSPMELAEEIAKKLRVESGELRVVERIEAAKPGFINFYLKQDYFVSQLSQLLESPEKVDLTSKTSKSQNIMVEYAHPNTHKEMHIGHMRTLITGEAISRILESRENKVFRANYQGDIGPHVAKALYGIQKIMKEENLSLDEAKTWTNPQKAHFLGRGYVVGNQDYEDHKEEIDGINTALYGKVSKGGEDENVGVDHDSPDELRDLYQLTRKWSLDYYDEFYTRFYTQFDSLFFESQVADFGRKIVEENIGKVFVKDEDGSVIFPGENYGLHTRVFVTKAGNPTYEGKEMGLGFKEYEAFPFDKNIHVVASEQAGYFKVVIKALELIDPEKFKDHEYHLSMGMVQLTDRKMSSRTGEVLTVDWLIDKVKEKVASLVVEGKIKGQDLERITEEVVIGAIKYSVLKVSTGQNVQFDIEKSVSLDGNSGPYLQYTYARTQSVISKFKIQSSKFKVAVENSKLEDSGQARMTSFWGALATPESLEPEELSLLRGLERFGETVEEAAKTYNPSVIAGYLFDLAQKFNLFYQRHSILDSANSSFRLALTEGTGMVLKQGLNLLGIKAPERM